MSTLKKHEAAKRERLFSEVLLQSSYLSVEPQSKSLQLHYKKDPQKLIKKPCSYFKRTSSLF